MSRKDKRRAEEAARDRKGQPAGGTAQALYARGEYRRAAYSLLPKANRREASAEELRLLADCYLQMGNPSEALAWLDALPAPTPASLALAGQCLLAQGRWREADARFAAAGETAEAALGRADALLRSRALADLSPTERAELAERLGEASRLPECPPRAFALLADLTTLAGDDPSRQADVLRRAVAAHPDLVEFRLRLARLLVERLDEPGEAHAVLRPLLLSEEAAVDPEVAWLALRSVLGTPDVRLGLDYVERLRPCFAASGVGPDKLAGDVYLQLGEADRALECYEVEIRREEPLAQLVGLFSRTEALIALGRRDEVQATARLALGRWETAWADGADLPWLRPGGGTLHLTRPGDPRGRDFAYPYADGVERACRWLARQSDLPEPELAALASCLLFYMHGCPDDSEAARWLAAAEPLGHPRLGEPLARRALASGELGAAVRHILTYCLWLARRSPDRAAVEQALAEFLDRGASRLVESLHGEARLAVHQAALTMLDAEPDRDLARRVFVPFYYAFWKALLAAEGLYDELLRLTGRLDAIAPGEARLLLDRAEILAERGLLDTAERALRDVLQVEPANAAAHRGLSALYERRQALREAVRHSAEVLRLAPSPEQVRRHESLQARLAEEEQRGSDYEDLLKSAPYRWRLLSPPERNLLGVLSAISGFRDWGHLARLAGLAEASLAQHWQRLVDLGMITWSASRAAYEVNEHIRSLVVADHPVPVLSRVIASGTESAVKCLFNSSLEAEAYRALLETFPNHLVLPDVALSAVFDYEQMQRLLSPDDFAYFRQARVDFCVVSSATYVPFLAIEIDSHYHDVAPGVERDRAKDAIFTLGGLPLLRFRPLGGRDGAAIRRQMQEVVRALRDELRGQIARGGYRNARAGLQQAIVQA